mgnify:CR=1 FL=1
MKKLIILMSVMAFCLNGYSQSESRKYIHLGASVTKSFLDKKLEAGLETEGRFRTGEDQKQWLITPKISYEPIKYFSVGLQYRFNLEHDGSEDPQNEWVNRLSADLKGKLPAGNFKFEFRFRYCNYNEDFEKGSVNYGRKEYLRYRFEVDYKIKPIKLTPYISYEWFQNLALKDVDRDRWTFGLKQKLNKHNKIGFEYMFQENFNNPNKIKDIYKHIFAFSYSYNF